MKEINKIILAAIVMVSGLGYLAYQTYEKNHENIVEIIEEQVEKAIKEPVVTIDTHDALQDLLANNNTSYVIFCHMDDCHWCEQMAPVVQDVAAHPELQSIQFYSVNSQLLEDSDVIPKVIGKEIDGFPFFVCMDQGKCIHQIDGYSKPEDFAKEIKNSFTKL